MGPPRKSRSPTRDISAGTTLELTLPPTANPAVAESFRDGVERVVELLWSVGEDIERSVVEDADRVVTALRSQIHPNVALLEERAARMDTLKILLETGEWLTAEQINKLQLTPPKNMAHPASDWKRRGRIFSVVYGGKEYFARYQFDEVYQPLPVIKEIIAGLGTMADTWKIAAWFHFPNGWIAEGEHPIAPKDALDRRDDVVNAARKRSHEYVA
jgi:hypothetical protein